MSVPFQLPLIALVPSGNWGISRPDSLARTAYARNKVRSITKLQMQEKTGEIDSVEYVELDRRGNKVLTYDPTFRTRALRRYDARNRLVELVQLPSPGYPYQVREVMDPVHNTYTAYHDLSEAPNHLYSSVTHRYHADTLVGTAELHQPQVRQGYTLTRLVSRKYTAGPDTTRLDLFGYDATGQARVHEALYFIYKQKALTESGEVSFEPVPQPRPARPGFRPKGRYQPTTLFGYDARGQLITTENRQWPSEPAPVSTQGQYGTLTTVSATTSRRLYQYDHRGQLVREEIQAGFPPAPAGIPARPNLHLVTTKTYSAKGLLLTETQDNGHSVVRYEYRYTYY
ncbi:hypothetical protein GCM10027175_04360 [Hymenobacter latericoloratus]